MNKKAQFFILSAVIIASIIVSMVSIKNEATTADVPSKFYYFSQQLQQETGAVVDYALYSNGGTTNITDFLQQGITKTKSSYPDMDIYACYSGTIKGTVYCQNNGTQDINVTSSCTPGTNTTINPTGTVICKQYKIDGSCAKTGPGTPRTLLNASCTNSYINFTIDNYTYPINIDPTTLTSGQFYLVFRMNSSAGELASDSSNAIQNGVNTATT